MTPQPQYSGLATSVESEEPLLPHQPQHHLQGPLALHLLVQLDPGEGRGEGHGDTGRTAGARTSWRDGGLERSELTLSLTGLTCTGVHQGLVAQQA